MLLNKICNTCEQSKKIEDFYFSKQKNRHENDCKKCYQEKKSLKREERIKNGAPRYIAKKKKCIDCDNLCDARKRILRCYSCSSKHQYKNSSIRKENIQKLNKKIHSDPKHKNKISENMKVQRKSKEFNKLLASAFAKSNRFSKLHKNIINLLDLKNLGFKSECLVSKYFADELNEDRKIIIEINGDYVHANPKFYKEDDVIKLLNSRYTAKEKWDSDKNKKEVLESLGYKVLIIWESDNIEEKKKELMELLK